MDHLPRNWHPTSRSSRSRHLHHGLCDTAADSAATERLRSARSDRDSSIRAHVPFLPAPVAVPNNHFPAYMILLLFL